MHDHKPKCKHELEHCQHCDVVYCQKCGREWGKEKVIYRKAERYPHWWPYWGVTTTTQPTPETLTNIICTHGHS